MNMSSEEKSTKKELTAHELRRLPAILMLPMLQELGYEDLNDALAAHVKSGLLDIKGDGVYHSVLAGPYYHYDAIELVIPHPIVGYLTSLHDYGVITQIPSQLHIISVGDAVVPALKDVVVMVKSEAWLEDAMAKKGIVFDKKMFPIPAIHPQLAWEEIKASGERFGLDPDDLDFFWMLDDVEPIMPVEEMPSTFDTVPGFKR